jgi:hypothetical protein
MAIKEKLDDVSGARAACHVVKAVGQGDGGVKATCVNVPGKDACSTQALL